MYSLFVFVEDESVLVLFKRRKGLENNATGRITSKMQEKTYAHMFLFSSIIIIIMIIITNTLSMDFE